MPSRDPAPDNSVSARQALWPVVEAGGAALLSAVSAFLLARLIGPAELGIGAAAVAVNVLLCVGASALFADALTQSPSTDPRELSSALWAAAAVGLLASVVQAGAGLLLVLALGDARLLPMSLALALPLPFVGAAGAMQGLLTRARRYQVLAGRAIAGQGLGTVLGVGAALAGGGAWALVVMQMTTALLGAGFLLARAGWRPILAWRWRAVRGLLDVGLPVAASTMVQQGRYRVFIVLAGTMLGPAGLGQLHLAFRLVDTVRDLAHTVLWRLLLPGFAERRDDPPGLRAALEQALGTYGPILFPLCAAMLLAVEPLTVLLLGPTWTPSGEAAVPLVLLMAWLLLGAAAGIAVVARGNGRLALLNSLAGTGVTIMLALLVHPQSALEAVLVWCAAHVLVAPWIAWRNGLALETPPTSLYRAGLPSLTASAFALLAGYFLPLAFGEPEEPAFLITVRLVIAAMAYLPYAVVFLRADMRAGWRATRQRVAATMLAASFMIAASMFAAGAGAQTVLDFVPQTIPGYDARFGAPLLARAQNRLRDLGLQFGPIIAYPALEAGMGYSSNVLGSANGAPSGFGAVRGSLLATAEQEDMRLAAYGSVDNRSYISTAAQNRTNGAAALGGTVNVGGGTLAFGGAFLAQHQDRSDVESRPSDAPIPFQVVDFRAAYAYRFNRLTLAPNFEFTAYRFSNTTVFGIPSSQAFRNRDAYAGGIGARYELAPDLGLLGAIRAVQTNYTQPALVGPNHDSTSGTFLTGLASTGEAIWRYSVLAGVEARRFVGPGQGVRATPVADLQVQWFPTPMTDIGLRLTRSMDESAWRVSTGSTVTRIRLFAEHEYLRDVILQAYTGVQLASFNGFSGNRASLNGGARVVWVVNRNMQVSLGYDLARWNENIVQPTGVDTERMRNLVLASIRLTP